MTATFDTVPRPLASTFARSCAHAHRAAQLVAAAGVTWLPPDPAFRYSAMTFDGARGALVGSPLPGDRRVRVVLDGLVLELDAGGGTRRLPLLDHTIADGVVWLEEAFGRTLVFPDWELPAASRANAEAALAADPDDLRALAAWYAATDTSLRELSVEVGEKGDVVLWPHHFDLAVLVTIEPGRTVGLGLSPGDERIPLPYLYVTPWPYPRDRPTPPLRRGRWQTEPWYGLVLDAQAIDSQRTVTSFLRDGLVRFSAL